MNILTLQYETLHLGIKPSGKAKANDPFRGCDICASIWCEGTILWFVYFFFIILDVVTVFFILRQLENIKSNTFLGLWRTHRWQVYLHSHVGFSKNCLCIYAFRQQLMEIGMCLIVFLRWFRAERINLRVKVELAKWKRWERWAIAQLVYIDWYWMCYHKLGWNVHVNVVEKSQICRTHDEPMFIIIGLWPKIEHV